MKTFDPSTLRLRRARPDEGPSLSALALRSKGYWGYSPAFLDACRDELSYGERELSDPTGRFAVAEQGTTVVGFTAILAGKHGEGELEALFVEPEWIGHGVGRRLLGAARQEALELGLQTLWIQGDPNAEAFYRAAGARLVGTRPSASIPGRELPLFRLALEQGP